MATYLTSPGDSLPYIAEIFGHPGEWSTLLELNQTDTPWDHNNVQPGMEIVVPDEWVVEEPSETSSSDATTATTTSSSSSRSSSRSSRSSSGDSDDDSDKD